MFVVTHILTIVELGFSYQSLQRKFHIGIPCRIQSGICILTALCSDLLQNVIYLLIALGIGIITVVLENGMHIVSHVDDTSIMYLIMCGAIMSFGIVVPGVSSTIILMLLGVYSVYLQSVANLYLPVLIPLGIGLILGSIIVMKLTKKLLETYYAQTFYSIIGFTIGSIFVLLPQGMTWLEIILCALCIILGIYISRIPDTIKNLKFSKALKATKVLNKMRSQSKTQND